MIKILCVGKIKETFYQEAIKEYMKRLSKYHKVVIEELPDSTKQKEEDLLLKKINPKFKRSMKNNLRYYSKTYNAYRTLSTY